MKRPHVGDSVSSTTQSDAMEQIFKLLAAVDLQDVGQEIAELLRSFSSRHAAILAAVPDILVEVDADKVYTWANTAGREFFGDDVVGHEAAHYFEGDQDTYEVVQPLFNGAADDVIYLESWQRRRDGQRRLLAWWCRVLKDDSGNVVGALSSARDITERNRAEVILREREAQLRSVLDSTPFPVALVDFEDSNIEFWSRSALNLFGHTAPTAGEWYQLAYPDPEYQREVVEKWKPSLERAQRSGRAVNAGEYRITCKDGSVRVCELHTAFLEDRLVVTFNDITERKRAEEQVHSLNEELQKYSEELEQRVQDRTAELTSANEQLRAENAARSLAEATVRKRNDELKDFAYTVSHDLKAPLRGIAGYANELERRHKTGLSERAQFCITQINTAAGNLDRLIEDLLHYSRLDAETPSSTEVNLRALVEAILKDRSLILSERNIDVTLDIPFSALRTWERGLYQVLTNLIDNAVKYTKEADPPRLVITAEELPDGCRVTVADNGIGFNMKYHDRIFGLFNRLVRADEFEGTGAGLAIVTKLMDKLGGTIRAESAPGEGATFIVELPAHSPTRSPT